MVRLFYLPISTVIRLLCKYMTNNQQIVSSLNCLLATLESIIEKPLLMYNYCTGLIDLKNLYILV